MQGFPRPLSVVRYSQLHYLASDMGLMLPSPESPREHARELMARKDVIEAEIKTMADILIANSSDMISPLVDSDGFPRADIDIYAIRRARARIIELRNDLRDVTNEVGKALEQIYDPALVAPATAAPRSAEASLTQSGGEGENLIPFARVDGVAPGSPAAESGLCREDLIVKFGSLSRTSFMESSLQPLAELVSVSENRELRVQVLRREQMITLTFTPRKGWGGRGMLGYVSRTLIFPIIQSSNVTRCHIVPYNPAT
ncbi:hypothetical protein ID866_1438 [Astraeus odoratus]|nr:hypothetical protein ID866_1438 [Astraeus odoratus]